jgi:hypothetical protein
VHRQCETDIHTCSGHCADSNIFIQLESLVHRQCEMDLHTDYSSLPCVFNHLFVWLHGVGRMLL